MNPQYGHPQQTAPGGFQGPPPPGYQGSTPLNYNGNPQPNVINPNSVYSYTGCIQYYFVFSTELNKPGAGTEFKQLRSSKASATLWPRTTSARQLRSAIYKIIKS